MTRMEKIGNRNRDCILKHFRHDLVRHAVADHALRCDLEHTKGYAIFRENVLDGYILMRTKMGIPTVFLESKQTETAHQLVNHAPRDHFIMHIPLGLLDVVKSVYPSANYYFEDWMLLKKAEARFFKSNLVRKLERKKDALQLARLNTPPTILDILRGGYPSASQHFQSLILARNGETEFLVHSLLRKLKSAEWIAQFAQILGIGKTSSERWRARARYEMWLSKTKVYGAFVEGRLVAHAAAPIKNPKTWVIEEVYTIPEFRNKGYATLVTSGITEEALKNSESASLFVRSDNCPAIKVYQKIGYRKIGERVYVDVGTGLRP